MARQAARTLPSSWARANARNRNRYRASSTVKAALLSARLPGQARGWAAFAYRCGTSPGVATTRRYDTLAERSEIRRSRPYAPPPGRGHRRSGRVRRYERATLRVSAGSVQEWKACNLPPLPETYHQPLTMAGEEKSKLPVGTWATGWQVLGTPEHPTLAAASKA